MSKLTIEHDTEFYGWLDGIDIIDAAKLVTIMREVTPFTISAANDTASYTVEEIVRRGGTFYTGTEARPIVPWNMIYTDVCAAKFGYLEDETRPVNPNYAEYNWIALNIPQYMYGKYLQEKIETGELSVDDIIH